MSSTANDSAGTGGSVEELLRQRQTVQGWLDRIDEHDDEISPRVVARVRADYQSRLEQVLEALSSHQAALQGELERHRSDLQGAQDRLDQALDELEEGRLRQLIGEISDEAWDSRRPGLEEGVEEARAEQWRLQTEAERLEEILAQMDAPAGTETSAAAAPEEVPVAREQEPEEEPGDLDPWDRLPLENATVDEQPAAQPLPEVDATVEEQPASQPLPELDATVEELPRMEPESADGLEFLEELDRAIAASPEDEPARSTSGSQWDGDSPTASKVPGVKCGECGYTNDATAWYCGVCGADLS